MLPVDRGGVFLDGADCQYLGSLLGDALAERARRDGGVPPRLTDIVVAVQVAGRRHRAEALSGSDNGTDQFRNGVFSAPYGPSATWLTVDQAAELLHCSPSYVRRLLRQRVLTGTRAGGIGAWRVDEAAVLDRLDEARRKAA